jgi:hypothetical protein
MALENLGGEPLVPPEMEKQFVKIFCNIGRNVFCFKKDDILSGHQKQVIP